MMWQKLGFDKIGENLFEWLGEKGYGTKTESYIDQAYTQMANFYKLCDLFPYDSYDEAYELFINDECVGFVLETPPLVGASEEMQKQLSNLFQSVLPEESGIQFMLWADPHIGDRLEDYKNLRAGESDILKTMASERVEYLNSLAYHSRLSPYCLRNFRCVISFNKTVKSVTSFVLEEVRDILTQVKTTLEMMRLPVLVWKPDHLINTINSILHLDPEQTRTSKYRWNRLQRISDQLYCPESNIMAHQGGLSLNNHKMEVRAYRVMQYPEIWSLHAMGKLIGDEGSKHAQIPCPFIIHYGVYIPKQDGPRAKVSAKASYVERQAYSPVGKYLPSIQREAAELEYVRQQLDKDGRVVHTQLNVLLFAPSKVISSAENILINLYSAKEWELKRYNFLHLPCLLTAMPMMWGDQRVKDLITLQTTKTTISTEPANLVPLQGEWHGTSTAGMLFAGRCGQLFSWYPYDTTSGGYNTAVIGKTGSGKSVFMQELLAATLGVGGTVYVLDIGCSFEKTCYMFGGQYIRFKATSDLCLNPFSSVPSNDPKEAAEYLALIKNILMMMAAPHGGLTSLETAILEKAISYVWQAQGVNATITDVAQFLLASQDQRERDLGTMLFPYTKEGNYGQFFNGQANVDIKSRLFVVEMSDLENRPDLREVVLQSLTIMILNRVYKSDRKKPIMTIIDEAADSLKGVQSSKFIDTAVRRFRKYESSLVVGTQTLNDFYVNADAQAAFENCKWKCFFNQSSEAISLLKSDKKISVTPHQESLMKSLITEIGKYSEVMIVEDGGYAVGRLLLDPFTSLLYSSKGTEYTAVIDLMAQGYKIDEAIKAILPPQKLAA